MNTRQKRILVDQDGVLANYVRGHLEAIRREFPELAMIDESEISEFDTDAHFPKAYRSRIEALSLRKGFFLGLQPIEGAIDAMKDMLASGHDVRICTAPKKIFDHCVAEKFAWVKYHLGQKWTERIILTRDKTLVHGDYLIDDKPSITGVYSPSWEHVFYDQPYNRMWDRPRLTWSNYKEVLGI